MNWTCAFFIFTIIYIAGADKTCPQRKDSICLTLTNKKCKPSQVEEAHCTRSDDCPCPKVCCVTNDCTRTCVPPKSLVEARSSASDTSSVKDQPSAKQNDTDDYDDRDERVPPKKGEMLSDKGDDDDEDEDERHEKEITPAPKDPSSKNALTYFQPETNDENKTASAPLAFNLSNETDEKASESEEFAASNEKETVVDPMGSIDHATDGLVTPLVNTTTQPPEINPLAASDGRNASRDTLKSNENLATTTLPPPDNALFSTTPTVVDAVAAPMAAPPPANADINATSQPAPVAYAYNANETAPVNAGDTNGTAAVMNADSKNETAIPENPNGTTTMSQVPTVLPDDTIQNREVIVQLMSLIPKLLRNFYRGRTVPSIVVKLPSEEYVYVPPLPGYDSNKRNMGHATKMFNPKKKALGMPWYKYMKNTRPFGPFSPGQYPYPIFMTLTHPGDVFNRLPEQTIPSLEEFFFRMYPPFFKPEPQEGFVLNGPLSDIVNKEEKSQEAH